MLPIHAQPGKEPAIITVVDMPIHFLTDERKEKQADWKRADSRNQYEVKPRTSAGKIHDHQQGEYEQTNRFFKVQVIPRESMLGTILPGKIQSNKKSGKHIALPGLFIALMMRIDKKLNNGSRYYLVSLISYHIGLLITFVVMHVFKHGQPALLYLVPALLFGTMGYALTRGELKTLLTFNENEDKNAEEEEEDDSDSEEEEENETEKEKKD